MKQLLLIFITLTLITGCETPSHVNDHADNTYMVNAYLIANEFLPPVTVHQVGQANEWYSYQENGVSDAGLQIHLLKDDGTVAESYDYYHYKEGKYLAQDNIKVMPGRRYQLLINFRDGHILEAKTLVPRDFEAVGQMDSSYVYQQDPQVEITATTSYTAGRPTYYLFTVKAKDRQMKHMVPFYKDLVMEKGRLPDFYYMNSSDITSATNYDTDIHGNLKLNIPWSVFAFYGQNRVTVNAIDNNIYHTWPLISPGLLTQGMSLSPDKANDQPSHINGGIGIFGSLSRVNKDVVITKSK